MIKKSFWLLVSLKLRPHVGPEWSEVWVVRGAAGSAAQFVLICPLAEPSGEISWILLQMFHCACMLGIRVGLFDLKWKMHRRGFAVRASASSARRVDQQLLPPPGFPRFPPAESTFCDQRHGNTTVCRLDPSFCRRSLQPFGKPQWKLSESLSALPTPASLSYDIPLHSTL